jgi:hypothetical protein
MPIQSFARVACLLGCLLSPLAVKAEECDPSKFLEKDKITDIRDIRTKIAYVNAMADRKDGSQNTNFANDVYSAYGISNMKIEQASKTSSLLQKLLKLDISQSDQHWLLVSALPQTDGGVVAYKECVARLKKAVVVTLDQTAATSKEFLLNVSHALFHPAQSPLQIKIVVANGGIAKKGAVINDYSANFTAGDSDVFHVVRTDMYKPLSIGIKIGADVLEPQISFPALSAFDIQPFTIRSEPFQWYLNDTHAVYGPKEICASIPDDQPNAVVVPKSVHVVYTVKIAGKGNVFDCGEPGQGCSDKSTHREIGDRAACASLFGSLGALEGVSKAEGYVEAQALKSVPIAIPAPPSMPKKQ